LLCHNEKVKPLLHGQINKIAGLVLYGLFIDSSNVSQSYYPCPLALAKVCLEWFKFIMANKFYFNSEVLIGYIVEKFIVYCMQSLKSNQTGFQNVCHRQL
jgi:hypothetical protein